MLPVLTCWVNPPMSWIWLSFFSTSCPWGNPPGWWVWSHGQSECIVWNTWPLCCESHLCPLTLLMLDSKYALSAFNVMLMSLLHLITWWIQNNSMYDAHFWLYSHLCSKLSFYTEIFQGLPFAWHIVICWRLLYLMSYPARWAPCFLQGGNSNAQFHHGCLQCYRSVMSHSPECKATPTTEPLHSWSSLSRLTDLSMQVNILNQYSQMWNVLSLQLEEV